MRDKDKKKIAKIVLHIILEDLKKEDVAVQQQKGGDAFAEDNSLEP